MNKTKKIYLAVLSTFLISGISLMRLNVEASEKMEQDKGGELSSSLDQIETIISGEAVNLDSMIITTFASASNPTNTLGGGKFWVSYPRFDQHRSHHTNPTYTHRSSASNSHSTVSSSWFSRGLSGTNGAQATIFSSGSGNTANWDVSAPNCSMQGNSWVCAP